MIFSVMLRDCDVTEIHKNLTDEESMNLMGNLWPLIGDLIENY